MSERELLHQRLPAFTLDSGEVLRDVVQAYHLDGELNAERDNLVVVFHALTGGPDAVGDWWSAVAGPGRALDTTRYAVLCPNLLGSCYGTDYAGRRERRARLTPRDMARLAGTLVEALGVRSVALATGGSLGGMVALEWAAELPERTRATLVLAAPAAHTASAIGWSHIQRRAVEAWGEAGLELARMVGMMTYRTPAELEARFGRARGPAGWQVGAYLSHHGRKLRRRFQPESYLALLGAMDAHDVGRGRGGVAAALRRVPRLTGVGIPGDVLYDAAEVRAWTEAAGAEYREIESVHGHDAFLLELEQVDALLREALAGELAETVGGVR